MKSIFTPICKAALLAATLAACTGEKVLAPDQVRLSVAGRDVILAAPVGFCFDHRTTDVNSRGAFLLAADCTVTTGSGAASGTTVTASVSTTPLPGSLGDLKTALGEGPAIVTLGRSGMPGAISVLASRIEENVLYFKIRDTAPQPVPGASGTFWRAFFQAGDRLISLSITTPRQAEPTDAAARQLLALFAARTRAANPDTGV